VWGNVYVYANIKSVLSERTNADMIDGRFVAIIVHLSVAC